MDESLLVVLSAVSPQGQMRLVLNRQPPPPSYCFVVHCQPIQSEIVALFSPTCLMQTTTL